MKNRLSTNYAVCGNRTMLAAIFAIVLVTVAFMLRKRLPSTAQRLGFLLACLGFLLWTASVDYVTGKDVVSNATVYKRVLLVSALGVLCSIAALIGSIWCRDKPLRIVTIALAALSLLLCAADIVVPY